MILLGFISAETDPAITCQSSRLKTRRALATVPARDQHLHLVCRRARCVRRSREREKRPAAGRENNADVQKKTHLCILIVI